MYALEKATQLKTTKMPNEPHVLLHMCHKIMAELNFHFPVFVQFRFHQDDFVLFTAGSIDAKSVEIFSGKLVFLSQFNEL